MVKSRQSASEAALNYETPPGVLQFKAIMALAISTFVVVGSWTLLWFAGQAWVQSTLHDWQSAQRAKGHSVEYSTLEVSGFPARIVLHLSNPQFKGAIGGQDITWQGETLTVVTRPWMPWKLRLDAPGKHALSMTEGAKVFTGLVGHLQVDLTPGDDVPKHLKVIIKDLALAADRDVLNVTALDFTLDQGEPELGLFLSTIAKNIIVPNGVNLPLGNQIQNVDVAARVLGPRSKGSLGSVLTAWRDGGGIVEFDRLKFRTGPLKLDGNGTFALDEDLQPLSAFTAKLEGLFQVIEELRAQGVVTGPDAVVATMALSALSKRSKNGEPSTINLALTVQDRMLNLGPIAFLKFPRFDWGIVPEPVIKPEAPKPRDYKNVAPVY